MSFLNAQAINAARDRRTVTVPCPEWGGDVLIGEMGALDAARIRDWLESLPEPAPPETEETQDDEMTVMTCDSPDGKPEPIPDRSDQADQSEESDESDESDKSDATDDSIVPRKLTHTETCELMLRYLAATILDPATYMPAFTQQQIEELGSRNPRVLNRLYEAALEIQADIDGATEDLAKNLPTTPADSSGGD